MTTKKHEHEYEVVITGIGLITPVGNDTKTGWQNLVDGTSGIKSLSERFDLENYSCKAAGLVQNELALIDTVLSPKDQSKTDRFIHLSLVAAQQAMMDAGFSRETPEDRERFGCYMGIGMGGLQSFTEGIRAFERGEGAKKISPFLIPRVISNEAVAWMSMQWNLEGPITAITNACSSGGDAIGLAFRAIRDGYADYMLAGGSEASVVPVGIVAFGNMRALSTWAGDPAAASRPFDLQRTGFVMSEGSAVLVLERKDMALKRGAHLYAELVGYGATSDAYHIIAMHPEGRGATRAIKAALDDAHIDPSAVGYINAHGTGTHMNDLIETKIIKDVFGTGVPVSSTKSMTGHMLGAAGAAEVAFTALALKHQILPPTINIDNPDPQCDLDYVPHTARAQVCDYAISNSFGFGGANAVLVLKRI